MSELDLIHLILRPLTRGVIVVLLGGINWTWSETRIFNPVNGFHILPLDRTIFKTPEIGGPPGPQF